MAACAANDDGATSAEATPPDTLDQVDSVQDDSAATEAPDQAQAPAPAPAPAEPAAPRQAVVPTPTVSTGGSSTVVLTPALAGTNVRINGSTNYDGYALVSYQIATGAMNVDAEFTVNPAPGAAFVYTLVGAGSGYSSKQLRLERLPGADTLWATTTTGKVACGALPSNRATTVTLAYDGTTKTFDVLIAGAASSCTNLVTKVTGPVMGFRLMDATNQGYGGQVDFSDMALLH